MLEGAALQAWAREKAQGLVVAGDFRLVVLALAEAYLLGAINTLQDETERKRNGVTLIGKARG